MIELGIIEKRQVFYKKVIFINFSKFTRTKTVSVSFLINLPEACNFIIKNKALAQVLSCEFCEIFRNTYFVKHLQTTAFDYSSTFSC